MCIQFAKHWTDSLDACKHLKCIPDLVHVHLIPKANSVLLGEAGMAQRSFSWKTSFEPGKVSEG